MADAKAIAYGRRIRAMFAGSAEGFTLERAGDGSGRRGFFAPMDNGTTSVYFDANEAVGLVKPALMGWLEGDGEAPQEGDIFTRDGRLWTVRKVQAFRQGGTVLVYLMLCD